tara:strand:- start:3247 stop:3615 length:369 start_codon:yes stop_codon:yes gene_type:complete
MSSSSGGRRSHSTTKSGFSESDVQNFLKGGNTLSRDTKESISSIKPNMQHNVIKTTENSSGIKKFFGMGEGGNTTTESGFMGKFSGMGQEELDRLTNSFLQRQSNIKQRVAQPGRSGFLIQR